MRRAAVDIGTNSMRLLVVEEDGSELGRWQRVTGLGRGVDATGSLADDAIDRTIGVLAEYGELMRRHRVGAALAVATSATRDAANRESFLDRAEQALGVRPITIGGEQEARYAYMGATAGLGDERMPVVVDIGGGSTELVWREGGGVRAVSVDVGSVRLTDRVLPDRPATFEQLEAAVRLLQGAFATVEPPERQQLVVGVAGTWTSLAAIHLGLESYDRERVHHSRLERLEVDRLVERLAGLNLEETAAIPALDPARAPVILAGALVAREVMRLLAAPEVLVSERDLLHGVVASL